MPSRQWLLTRRSYRLWGNPKHLNHLRDTLEQKYSTDQLHILVAKSNADSFTYDGINVGGERITNEIEQEIRDLSQKGTVITRISMVGYSLGGLVARYSIGLLYKNGVFDEVEPVNFTTFATPHLGVRSPTTGTFSYLFNVLGPRTLSASGQQMFLSDTFQDTGRPLLSLLAEPNSIFMKGLALFKNKSVYANVINDRSVPYFTSCISETDPYTNMEKVDVHYLHDDVNLEDPVLLDPENPVTPVSTPKPPPTFIQALQTFKSNLPFYALATTLFPVVITGFVASSIWSTYQSAKRVQLHEAGKAGISLGRYRMPLLEDAEAVQSRMASQLANTQQEEYLPTPPPESAASSTESVSSIDAEKKTSWKGLCNKSKKRQRSSSMFPVLNLRPEQFEMIEHLDALGITKYPVYIKNVRHTHAAIVVRTARTSSAGGKVVSAHWAREFEV